MRKIAILLSLLMLSLSSCDWLNSTFGPKEEPIPEETGGEFEILYERVLPVINPDGPDLAKGAAAIYHLGSKYGGGSSSLWEPVGENKWTAIVQLAGDKKPYAIWLTDYKVVETKYGEHVECIARKIFMRIKGDSNWIELVYIEKNQQCEKGE